MLKILLFKSNLYDKRLLKVKFFDIFILYLLNIIDNLFSLIETSEVELFPGFRSSIQSVRPIVDAEATVTIKTRDRLADSVTSSSEISMNDTGVNPVRQSGRYVKVNVKTPSGVAWNHAQGIDLIASRSGLR